MSVERLTTVAEVVASLPSLAVLLGMEGENAPPAARASDRATGATRTVGTATKVAARPTLPTHRSTTASTHPAVTCASVVPREEEIVAAGVSGGLAAAVDADRQRIHEDRRNWRRIQDSLNLPLVNRRPEDVELAVEYLRRIPFFHELSEGEVLAVAGEMMLLSTMRANVQVARVACFGNKQDTRTNSRAGQQTEQETRSPLPSHLGRTTTPSRQGVRRLVNTLCQQQPPPTTSTSAGGNPSSDHSGSLLTPALAAAAASEVVHKRTEPSLDTPCNGQRGPSVSSGAGPSQLGLGEEDRGPVLGEDEDEDESMMDESLLDPLMALVEGAVLLELPTATGKEHFPLVPGDVFGYGILTAALPVGARYVTTEPCLFLHIHQTRSEQQSPFRTPVEAAIRHAEDRLLRQQLAFLREQVKLPLVAADGPSEGANAQCRESPLHQHRDVPNVELDMCARNLIPLRLSNHQVLAAEGDASDAMFFVAEGRISASRVVTPHRAQAGRRGEPRTRSGAVMMDVATLCPGELCGELALIGYNPDVRPGEGTIWTDDYWREALASRFRAPPTALDGTNAMFLQALSDTTQQQGTEGRVPPPKLETYQDIEKQALFAEAPPPRLATLYSVGPSLVYRLGYPICRDAFSVATVTWLRERAKGYASMQDLRDRCEQQRAWETYKKGVFDAAVAHSRRK